MSTYADEQERVMLNETCPNHAGMRLPCPFNHDDAILNDLDAVVEQLADQRTFEFVLQEWFDVLLEENRALPNKLEVIAYASPLLIKLSGIGARLLNEAHDCGMRRVMKVTREVLSK